MKTFIFTTALLILFAAGCDMSPPDEREIKDMLEIFVAALERGDEGLARTCLLDVEGFQTLNPDVSARVDAESFMETSMAELIHNYRDLSRYFRGRTLELKDVAIGTQWYQYKGRQAFKDTDVTLKADGEEVHFKIRGIVKIDTKWRIADLSGIPFLE